MPQFESTNKPTKYGSFFGFRVGTCEGLWRFHDGAYEILAVLNTKKGNGHFAATMHHFETSARRDKVKLRLLEVFNLRLYFNSVFKYGYKRKKGTIITLEKSFI